MHSLRSLLCGALVASVTSTSLGQTSRLVLTGAKVLDPSGQRLLDDRAVVIKGNRIQKVTPSAALEQDDDAVTIDLTGFILIPGLIDLHSHLLLHPYDEASWNDQVLKESLALRTVRGAVAARATLEAGFTTLRDLGTEGAGYADVGIRDAIEQGIIPGPRVFAATRAIVATGCYGPSGFDPRWDMPKGAQVADGVDGVRKAVREQIAAGADWIKVYADYWRVRRDPATPTFSQAELNAIVDEASSANVPVAAHAWTDEAIRRAVDAGVKTIEHGSDASTEVLELMRRHDVVLCPTLSAVDAMARYGGWKPGEPEPKHYAQSIASFKRALKSGVAIAFGSDVGVFAHGDNARELELMIKYGMTRAEALRSATITAARVLGRSGDLGRIDAGYLADLVALRANPLTDTGAYREIAVVVKNGKVVVDLR